MPGFHRPSVDITHERAFGVFVTDPEARDRRAALQAGLALSEVTEEANGAIDGASLARLSRLRFELAGSEGIPDVVGGLSPTQPLDLAVSDPLMRALAPVVGDAVAFLPVPNMWDQSTGGPWSGTPYAFLNIRARIDGWDPEQTEIYATYDQSGSVQAEFLQGTPVLNLTAAGNTPIWRDSRTGTVVISDRVRAVFDRFDCAPVYYLPVLPLTSP